MTKALLLKRYRNDGGALSEGDATYFNELVRQLATVEDNYQRFSLNLEKLSAADNEKRVSEAFQKRIEILQKLQTFETINKALFSHTAESKADLQLSNWWTVFLAYWDEKDDGNFVEFFAGETFEQKMEFWDKIYDEQQEFFIEALARFSLLVGIWNSGAQTPKDFEDAERQQFAIPEPAEEVKTPIVNTDSPVPAVPSEAVPLETPSSVVIGGVEVATPVVVATNG